MNLLANYMIGYTQLEKGSAYGKEITKKKGSDSGSSDVKSESQLKKES